MWPPVPWSGHSTNWATRAGSLIILVLKQLLMKVQKLELIDLGLIWFEGNKLTSPQYLTLQKHLSHLMTKPTKWHVHPAKTQISLGIRPVWSESSLSAWRKLGSLATHWAHSEDSDQTGQMPRLIGVFAGLTCHFVGFVTWRPNFVTAKPNSIGDKLKFFFPHFVKTFYKENSVKFWKSAYFWYFTSESKLMLQGRVEKNRVDRETGTTFIFHLGLSWPVKNTWHS